MVFLGLLLIVTKYVDIDFSTINRGYLFHVIASLVVIPIDFIFDFDFMLYRYLGGVPFFESIAENLISLNLGWLNPLIMLILYYIAFNIVFIIPLAIDKLRKR